MRSGWIVLAGGLVVFAACGSPGAGVNNPPGDAGGSADAAIGDRGIQGDRAIGDGAVLGDGGGVLGDAADRGGTDGGGGSATSAPQFGGVSLAWADGIDRLGVQWVAAVDDVTPPNQLVYQLYIGATAAAVLAAADAAGAPQQTLTGVTSTAVTGLTAGQKRFLVAVAVDADGNRSVLRNAISASTAQVATVLRQAPKDLSALGVTVAELGYDRFSLTGAGAASIAANDLVIVENTFGRSLRRAVTLTANGAAIEMTTTKAYLGDVFAAGEIKTSALLVDEDVPVAASPDPVTRMKLEQRGRARSGAPYVPGTLAADDGMEELENGVSLAYEMSFDPQFDAYVKFAQSILGKPERVRFTATGVFAINATAMYSTSGKVEYDTKKELFSKTMRFVYTVGGVPVYQEVILSLVGEVELKAETNFTAQAKLDAQKTVTIGFDWSQASGFQPIKEDGFTQTTTFSVTSGAKAEATIKVYPVLKTRFYKMLSGSLEVVPQVSLEAEARFLPLPVELTKADVDFFVDAQVSADLSIFSKELWKTESDRYELYRVPIHSLPDLAGVAPVSAGNTCHPTTFYVRVQDGYRNAVQPQNIGIRFMPVVQGGPVASFNAGRTRGEITSTVPGTYTVELTAHGDGILGVLGTRYARFDVTFADPGMPCNMVPPPIADRGITCGGVVSGLVAPPYFTTNRHVIGAGPMGDNPRLILPVHAASIGAIRWAFSRYPYLFWLWDSSSSFQGPVVLPDPFDAFYEVNMNLSALASGIYVPGTYLPALIDFVDTSIGGIIAPNGEFTIYRPNSTVGPDGLPLAGTTYRVTSVKTGPDGALRADDESCEVESGIPVPTIEFVGPAAPKDTNDTPGRAYDIPQFSRVRGQLPAGDVDFFRFAPGAPAGVQFDYAPLPMDAACFVRFTATAAPPPTITVYRGEQSATANANVVASGLGEVTFAPNPLEVYFAKISGPGTPIPDYVVEVASDCTAATRYPSITGPIMVSSSTVTRGTPVTISVPVDALTEEVSIELVPADGTSGGSSGIATLAAGMATAVLPTSAGMAPGSYVVRVRVATIAPNMTLELTSAYLVDRTFSTTHYAVDQVNYVAGVTPFPTTRRPTTFAIATVTLQ